MNTDKLILLIDKALLEIDYFVANSKVYTIDKKPFLDYKNVLDLLRLEIQKSPKQINERVLRATRDISTSIAKEFEETSFADSLYKVIDFLYEEIPQYKRLELLRMDFGKGNPI